MKKICFLILLWQALFVFGCENIPQASGPLLVVVIMIKNEAEVIRATLQPFLQAGVDAYLVLDTGSQDDTVHIVRQTFADYGIQNGFIIEQPFVDFSTSRNYAIVCAEERFPHAQFFIMPDAEWYMQNVEGLLQFCKDFVHNPQHSFLVWLKNKSNFQFSSQRLFKPHRGIRFEGVVHESLNEVAFMSVPESSYFLWDPAQNGAQASRNRWVRDRDLLLQEAVKNPDNQRTMFYLAQTYDCLGDFDHAIFWYKKRCEIVGWDEEHFMAHYRLAKVYEAMGDWNQASYYYLQAYHVRPTRAESLVCLAQHYWDKQQSSLCFVYALAACRIPYPQSDRLFLEKNLYDFVRYDLLGRAAWYMQEFEIGEAAVKQALQGCFGDDLYLRKNLALYQSRNRND